MTKIHKNTAPKAPLKFRYNILTLAIMSSLLGGQAYAGTVSDSIDYQYFRDYAENKGQFAVGSSNIAIYDKQGQEIGTMLKDVPMPDFAPVNRNGIATLIDDQHIVSVAHNVGYGSVDFGQVGSTPDQHAYAYLLVNRNNENDENTGFYQTDFHAPRVHKLVTETAPANTSPYGSKAPAYSDKYGEFARLGSGTQYIVEDGKKTHKMGPYQYLTGGTLNKHQLNDAWTHRFLLIPNTLEYKTTGPMVNIPEPGDSGSPLFGYNLDNKQWELLGVLRGNTDSSIWYRIPTYELTKERIAKTHAGTFDNKQDNATIHWQAHGKSSTLSSSNQQLVVDLADVSLQNQDNSKKRPSLDHGKSVTITGKNATLQLANNINQGAGALYINSDLTIKGVADNTTYLGAGVSVAKDKTAIWQLHNPNNDRLSKIGQGTLHVAGVGKNLGSISVGDGTVILAQRADDKDERQAFSQVGIVSGRPTVVLADDSQLNPDDIYFGYRGGRLDVNGNDLAFSYIQNVDNGAQIVNHSTQAAHLTVGKNKSGHSQKDDVATFAGILGETDSKRTNGVLNVSYDPQSAKQLLLTGGTNLTGNLTAGSGTLLLSGRPTPHAYDYLNKKEVIIEDDWINRSYSAKQLIVGDHAKVAVGRNVERLTADIKVGNDSVADLGFIQNQSTVCIRSDHTGKTDCNNQPLSQKAYNSLPTTQIAGNSRLGVGSRLNLGKSTLAGAIRADAGSSVHLHKDSTWQATGTSFLPSLHMQDNAKLDLTKNSKLFGKIHIKGADSNIALQDGSHLILTGDSDVGSLQLDNAQISLNANFDKANTNANHFHTLTVHGDLSGKGRLNFLADLGNHQSDKMVIKGKATGDYVLALRNTGKERASDNLQLIELANPNANHSLTASLSDEWGNPYVDVGAYRYQLKQHNTGVSLHNHSRAVWQKGDGTTLQLPSLTIAKGDGVKAPQPPKGDIAIKGKSVTAQALPKGDISVKGDSVQVQQLPKGDIAIKGDGVKAQVLPKGDIAIKGKSVTAQALPKGDISVKGESVQAQQLPKGDIAIKGDGVKAQVLPKGDIAVAFNVGHQLLSLQLPQQVQSSLPQAQSISQYTNVALSDWSAQAANAQLAGQTLAWHLTKDTATHDRQLSVWANSQYEKGSRQSDNYRGYDYSNHLIQVGANKALSDNQTIGLAATQINARQHFADGLTGTTKTSLVAAYGKHTGDNGEFVLLDMGLGVSASDIKDRQKATAAKPKRTTVSAGVQIGKTWQTLAFDITPSVGIRHSQLAKQSYNLDGADVATPKLALNSYQAGVQIGKTIQSDSITWTPNLSAQYSHNSKNHSMTVNGYRFNQAFGNTAQATLGIRATTPTWQATLDVGYRQGNEIKRETMANVSASRFW